MEIFLQKTTNDCSYAIIKTFYKFYYNKNINPNLLPDINNELGLSLSKFEKLCNKFNLYASCYEYSIPEIKNQIIKCPFVIVGKEEEDSENNHYYIVTLKTKKVLKLNDLNGISKVYTYDDFQKIYSNILIKITPKKNNYKELLISGILENIDLYKLLFPNIKKICFTVILILLYCVSNFYILFYFFILFNKLFDSPLVILTGFVMIIFNSLFYFGYKWLISIIEKNITKNIMKNFYYNVFYKKTLKKEKLSKINFIKYKDKYQFIAKYIVQVPFYFCYVLFINIIFLSILFIYKMYIIILLWFLILIISNILVYIINKYYIKYTKKYDKQKINSFKYFDSLNNQNISKNIANEYFVKLNNIEKDSNDLLFNLQTTHNVNETIIKTLFNILFISIITIVFFIGNISTFKIIIILLMYSYSYYSFKTINKIIEMQKIYNVIKKEK